MAVLAPVASDCDLVPRIRVTEEPAEYLIELDVSGFTEQELSLGTFGHRLTVIGDQESRRDLDGGPHVARRLEESFRLPDDADVDRVEAFHADGALEIHVRRRPLRSRRVAIERKYLVDPTPKGC